MDWGGTEEEGEDGRGTEGEVREGREEGGDKGREGVVGMEVGESAMRGARRIRL